MEVAAELLETAQSEAVKVRLIEVLVGEGKAPPSGGARGRTVRAGRGGVRVPGPLTSSGALPAAPDLINRTPGDVAPAAEGVGL